MMEYLQVRIGRLGLLVPVLGVLEILEVSRLAIAAGHHPWRDTVLPVLEGRMLLGEALEADATAGEPAALLPAVVYRPAPESLPVLLLVDRVAGLTAPTETAILLRAPAAVLSLCDCTVAGENGERLYCLRYPLARLD